MSEPQNPSRLEIAIGQHMDSCSQTIRSNESDAEVLTRILERNNQLLDQLKSSNLPSVKKESYTGELSWYNNLIVKLFKTYPRHTL